MQLCGFDVGLDRRFFLIAGTCSIEGLQMSLDVAILAVGLFIRDPLSVGLSVVGALALNLVLAVNHKQGRYLGT